MNGIRWGPGVRSFELKYIVNVWTLTEGVWGGALFLGSATEFEGILAMERCMLASGSTTECTCVLGFVSRL